MKLPWKCGACEQTNLHMGVGGSEVMRVAEREGEREREGGGGRDPHFFPTPCPLTIFWLASEVSDAHI